MSVLKTKPTDVSAGNHIAAIANGEQRNDAQTLVALMRSVTKHEPRMWGPSLVGFGSRPPIVIDARLKPGLPRELTWREDIAQLVTRRWKEYFPSSNVEMGDAERAHLD